MTEEELYSNSGDPAPRALYAECTTSPDGMEEEDEPYDCTPQTHRPPEVTPTPSTNPELTLPYWNRKRKLASPLMIGGGGVFKYPRLDKFESSQRHLLMGFASSRPHSESTRRFESILDRPFLYWKDLNTLMSKAFPEWNSFQRGRMIHHLVHFLELKVGVAEYVPTGLLLPTPAVDQAWRALLGQSDLYSNITGAIHDFHAKPNEKIYYTVLACYHGEVEEKLRRTQSLFKVYFRETMPMSVEEEQPILISSPTFECPPPVTPKWRNVEAPIFEFTSPSLMPGKSPSKGDSSTAAETQSVVSDDGSETLMGLHLLE